MSIQPHRIKSESPLFVNSGVQPMGSNSRSLDARHCAPTMRTIEKEELTSIVGGDALNGYLEHEIADARDHGTPLSLLLLDLCGWHAVNEACGHRACDQMLLEVARLLQNDVGQHRLLGRIALSEFLVVLKGYGRSDAIFLGERMQTIVGRFKVEVQPDQYARVSLSFGVAEFGVNGDEVDDLLRVATMETHRNTALSAGDERVWRSDETLAMIQPH